MPRCCAASTPKLLVADAAFADACAQGQVAPAGTLTLCHGAATAGWPDWHDWLASGAGEPLPSEDIAPQSTLLLCYTSGSTGTPKGVQLSHRALAANADASVDMHAMTADDRVLTTLPLFHVGGLNILTTPALRSGCSVTLHAKFDADATFDAIERDRITLTVLVPAQLEAMLAHPRWASADLSSLRMITTGSTLVPERLIHTVQARGVPLVTVWGATETSPIAACLHAEDAARKVGSTGRAALGCELRVIDPFGEDVPPGASGELLVRGPNLMSGYWHDDEANAKALGAGWFHSGDSAHYDADGFLYVDGRLKDMIISGGENVSPAEVEAVLLDCPEIATASVVGRPDQRWGELVVAVVVPQPGVAADGGARGRPVRRPAGALQAPQGHLHRRHPAQHRAGQGAQGRRTCTGREAGRATCTGANRMTLKLGIDVGGTFTDFVIARDGQTPQIHKTLSTPADPSIAVIEGLTQIAAAMEPPITVEAFARSIDTIVHGTTVTTNATLTGTGAKCALLTTEGVRDALEMRRGIREEQYNNRFTNVTPLVPRARRLGVPGRLDRDGAELTPLDDGAIRAALQQWRAEGVQAVAVCFMNSFANPAHEQTAAALVRSEMPDAYVSVSTEVLPSIRFYERVSTTALNAYVGPKLEHYLDQLLERLAGIEFTGLLLIMQSNGGVISPQAARDKAALTLLSGPAGGPGAGLFYAAAHGQDRCITTDMGGTSFEASVAVGAPLVKNDGEIARHKIALPMLDIHTIGAGGGSIGWLDEGGLLRMGPQSAGADPGPACYGRGGKLPTTTDANVVLGYLDPAFFAGGRMTLDVAAARAAIEEHIAKPMGLTVDQAAAGMYRVACNNMAQGVREVTIKRGFDPREFPLIPGGGAGPIHGSLICSELEIPLQIVPREASVLCAFGMLMCELRHDFVRTFVARLEGLDWARLNDMVGEMRAEGERLLGEERVPAAAQRIELKLDCRYLKQYHEVSVPVPLDAVQRKDGAAVARAFHDEHLRLYGYSLEAEDSPVEIINVRLQAIGATDRPHYRSDTSGSADASAARKGSRRVYIPERDDFAEVDVYDGHAMRCGHRLRGPALVEQQTTAIFVSESFDCTVDAFGSFVLFAKGREDLIGGQRTQARVEVTA